jgi:predicted nucleic acid-binding protein
VIVIDASAAISLLTRWPLPTELRDRIDSDWNVCAPHLIDVEFMHGIRRFVARGWLSLERANDARVDFADLPIRRYPHQPFADRMWELRQNLTAYDAAYIALSEALDAPLVTCDANLFVAPGHRAHVEAFPP